MVNVKLRELCVFFYIFDSLIYSTLHLRYFYLLIKIGPNRKLNFRTKYLNFSILQMSKLYITTNICKNKNTYFWELYWFFFFLLLRRFAKMTELDPNVLVLFSNGQTCCDEISALICLFYFILQMYCVSKNENNMILYYYFFIFPVN